MKRSLCLLLIVFFAFLLTGCSGGHQTEIENAKKCLDKVTSRKSNNYDCTYTDLSDNPSFKAGITCTIKSGKTPGSLEFNKYYIFITKRTSSTKEDAYVVQAVYTSGGSEKYITAQVCE